MGGKGSHSMERGPNLLKISALRPLMKTLPKTPIHLAGQANHLFKKFNPFLPTHFPYMTFEQGFTEDNCSVQMEELSGTPGRGRSQLYPCLGSCGGGRESSVRRKWVSTTST
jgi:hypothetical protein